MEELHRMGIISDEEFKSYLNPTLWVFRPPGSEYLTMPGMCDSMAACLFLRFCGNWVAPFFVKPEDADLEA